MSLATNVSDLATRIGTEFKAVYAKIGTLTSLTTTAKTNLVAAINELDAAVDAAAASGGATNLDQLTDVVIATPATGHVLRHNGTNFVNVLGTTHYEAAGAAAAAQSASQPLDADLTAIAALTTTSYGRAFLALADQAALAGLIPAASTTTAGKATLATLAEMTTGTDSAKVATVAGVRQERVALKAEILGAGVPAALDTLDELAAALADDANFATTTTTALGNRVRVDAAQGLNSTQQTQARTNIDAASSTNVGDTTTDFVATFNAALV